jgi:hypothetical protein
MIERDDFAWRSLLRFAGRQWFRALPAKAFCPMDNRQL